MISAGKNIQSRDDKLQKVSIDYFYNSLRNPKPEIEAKVRQLRIVKELDAKAYSSLKRQLPYIVCAAFNPPFRKIENFAYTEYFVLDIDHVFDKGLELNSLKEKLQKDPRVLLLFTSPGEDGLKIMFRLSERCYDAGIYTNFYKSFLHDFSLQYSLNQVIDTKTCDVARACFISVDKNVIYNADCESIKLENFFNVADIKQSFEKKRKLDILTESETKQSLQETHSKDPDDDILKRIKNQLKEKRDKVKRNEDVIVPEELNNIIDGVKEHILSFGIMVDNIINIQYAKKIQFSLGMRKSEINLFYGKHGFKVVVSPKSGTSPELNEIIAELIENYIRENLQNEAETL